MTVKDELADLKIFLIFGYGKGRLPFFPETPVEEFFFLFPSFEEESFHNFFLIFMLKLGQIVLVLGDFGFESAQSVGVMM